MKQERCLKQVTGSCAGCSILEIVRERTAQGNVPIEQVAIDVQASYCPEGLAMQTSHLTDNYTTHPMGQGR